MFDISAETMILGFNIAFFSTVFFAFLGGVIKGFRKSITFLIISGLLFVGAIFLIPIISEKLLDFDVSFVNQFVNIDGVEITSIRESISSILASNFPDQASLFVEDSETMAFIFGVIKMVLNLVLLLVFVILNATVLKIIPQIVWLFVRPKKNKDSGVKPKKHRLLGGLVGAIKGLAATILIAIPLAGITSFGLSAQTVLEAFEGQNANTNSAYVTQAEQEDNMDMLFEILGSYRKSIIGTIYKIPIGNDYVDEYLFDKVFEVKVKTKTSNQSLVLRKDFKHLTNILGVVLEANEGNEGLGLDLLFSITEDDISQIQKEIKGLSALNILKNVAAEYGYDFIIKENLHLDYEEDITLEALKNIDLNDEIASILEVVKVITKSENIDEITENVFALTKDEANEIFEILSEMKIIQLALPIGINFMFESDMVTDIIEEYDLKDIKKPTKEELTNDFKNIVNIYTLAKDIGFTTTNDLTDINEDTLLKVEDIHVSELFDIVFAFSFLYNNDELFANVVYNFVEDALPEDFKDIILRDTLVENFNASELSSIALLGKLIIEEGILNDEEEVDFVAILSDTNIEKIANYISGSNILSEATVGIFEMVAGEMMEDINLEKPEDLVFKGAEGKVEIKAIFYSLRDIFDLGLLDGDIDHTLLDETKVTKMAENFSSSRFIAHNLKNILTQIPIEDIDLEVPEDITFYGEDGKTELKAVFFSIKNLLELGLLESDFDHTNLDETVIEEMAENFSSSKLIAHNLKNIIGEIPLSDFEIVVPEDIEFYGLVGEEELKGIFFSIKNILELDLLESNFDYEQLSEIKVKEMAKNFSSSKLISHNLKDMIGEIPLSDFEIDVPEDIEFYGLVGEEELTGIFFSIKNILELDLLESNFDYEQLTEPKAEEIAGNFSSSKLISHNLKEMIGEIPLSDFEIEVPEDIEFYGPTGKTELKGMFLSFRNILEYGFLEEGFDYATLTEETADEMAENFSSSDLIAHNIERLIDEFAIGNFTLVMPDDIVFKGPEGKKELKSTFLSIKHIMELDMIDSTINHNILTNEKIDDISLDFSSSKIISLNFKEMITEFSIGGTELKTPEDIEFYGANGELEINAIFRSLKDILELDILASGFDYGTLTEPKVEQISVNFSDSRIIRYNLSPIINDVTEGTSFSFITSDEDENYWTKDEIYYTFNAVRIFGVNAISQSNIHLVSLPEIDEVARSLTISKAFENYLDAETQVGGSLSDVLVIPTISGGIKYESTETDHGEIYHLFAALKEMVGASPMEDFNPSLDDMVEMDVDTMFESYIIEATIVDKHILNFFAHPDFGKYVVNAYEDGEDFNWYQNRDLNTQGDTQKFIKSLMMLNNLDLGYNSLNYDKFITVLTDDPNRAYQINDAILSSNILNASLPVMLNQLINIDGSLNLNVYPHYKNNGTDLEYWGEVGVEGELYYILDSLVKAKNLNVFEYDTLDASTKDVFKDSTQAINKSETLRQMLPRIIDQSSLSKANALRTEVDPYTLTEQQWNNEIDILVEIIVKLNEYPTLDFDSPNPAHLIIISEIRLLMADSLLYDETKLIF